MKKKQPQVEVDEMKCVLSQNGAVDFNILAVPFSLSSSFALFVPPPGWCALKTELKSAFDKPEIDVCALYSAPRFSHDGYLIYLIAVSVKLFFLQNNLFFVLYFRLHSSMGWLPSIPVLCAVYIVHITIIS